MHAISVVPFMAHTIAPVMAETAVSLAAWMSKRRHDAEQHPE
jgi:hypothetical protein